jgi:hypothetical protein
MKKILLAVLVIVLVLMVAVIAFFYFNRDKIAQMAVEKSMPLIESTLVENLPAGVDREEVKQVFAAAQTKLKAGQYDIGKVQNLLMDFRKAYEDKSIDDKEFNKLYDELKTLAGK